MLPRVAAGYSRPSTIPRIGADGGATIRSLAAATRLAASMRPAQGASLRADHAVALPMFLLDSNIYIDSFNDPTFGESSADSTRRTCPTRNLSDLRVIAQVLPIQFEPPWP